MLEAFMRAGRKDLVAHSELLQILKSLELRRVYHRPVDLVKFDRTVHWVLESPWVIADWVLLA